MVNAINEILRTSSGLGTLLSLLLVVVVRVSARSKVFLFFSVAIDTLSSNVQDLGTP